MDTVVKKTLLSDSFEAQRRAAREVSNGILEQEIKPDKNIRISRAEIQKAQLRGWEFAKKYGF